LEIFKVRNCENTKIKGEASWLTPLEAQGISVTNCNGTLIGYRVNFSFIIVACCRLLTGLTERITMELEAPPPIQEASSIASPFAKISFRGRVYD
jgi:hypothetical protein